MIDSDQPFQELTLLKQLYDKSSKMISFSHGIQEKMVQKIRFQLQSLLQYYYGLQEQIEEMLYPRKDYYQLIIHMSSVYSLLNLGLYYLDQWVKKNPTSYREVLTVRRVDSDNFLGGKIIDFSKAKRDYYLYELVNYYLIHYEDVTILDELESFSMSKDDCYLMYALVSIVWKIDQENIEDVSSFIIYVEKTNSWLLQKYQEDQSQEKDVFEEK